jgi:hypothetical protein
VSLCNACGSYRESSGCIAVRQSVVERRSPPGASSSRPVNAPRRSRVQRRMNAFSCMRRRLRLQDHRNNSFQAARCMRCHL